MCEGKSIVDCATIAAEDMINLSAQVQRPFAPNPTLPCPTLSLPLPRSIPTPSPPLPLPLAHPYPYP